VFDKARAIIDNVAYNQSAGLTKRYASTQPTGNQSEHLLDRVDEVIRLSKDPRAKLQYFQAMFDFA
jgi:hypothetical protein